VDEGQTITNEIGFEGVSAITHTRNQKSSKHAMSYNLNHTRFTSSRRSDARRQERIAAGGPRDATARRCRRQAWRQQ
jgi:hypothetical protein